MVSGSSKRIVVIKDIQSNLIEEAILILKSPESKCAKALSKGNMKREHDFLVKEAELIINNYIKENKIHGGFDKRLNLRPVGISKRFLTNTFINIALVGSIMALIFLITKII